jgi:hypothetical protein
LAEKDGVWFVNLLVRWDETQEVMQADEGERIEYKYTAQRIVKALPLDVRDREEAIIYIENAKAAIIAEAQKQLARGATA